MNRRCAIKAAIVSAAAVPMSLSAADTVTQKRCEGDGTPSQFLPKNAPDSRPEENDIAKFPKCPYCGMDRKAFHHSRMLIHYSNEVPDATCSLHCAAVSLALNIDAEPKAIWVADNASKDEPKPLVEAAKASFLIGGSTPGVMTTRAKAAFGSQAAAKAAQDAQGGDLGGFDQALEAAYADMAKDVARIRKNREERRNRMKAMPKG